MGFPATWQSCVVREANHAYLPDTAFLKFLAKPLQGRIGLEGRVRLKGPFQLGVLFALLIRLKTSWCGSHDQWHRFEVTQ